jgi:hypothetical protein
MLDHTSIVPAHFSSSLHACRKGVKKVGAFSAATPKMPPTGSFDPPCQKAWAAVVPRAFYPSSLVERSLVSHNWRAARLHVDLANFAAKAVPHAQDKRSALASCLQFHANPN